MGVFNIGLKTTLVATEKNKRKEKMTWLPLGRPTPQAGKQKIDRWES